MDRRVLLVEDDEDVAATMSDLLSEEGYEVVVASTGGEGLAALQRGAYCLVLLDFRMPDMTGGEFLTQARRQGFDELSVVLVTASDLRQARGIDVPMLRKPVQYEALMSLVESHCGAASAS